MDIEMLDNNSDKENVGPDVRCPDLPVKTKTTIFGKQPIRMSPLRDRTPQTPANVARKRQRLSALKNTPLRASYSSQVSKLFANSAPPRLLERKPLRPITQDSLRVYEHFNQAIRGSSSKKASPSSTSQPVYSSDTTDGDSQNDENQRPTTILTPLSTQSEDPLNDLERAVAASFPPTPTREERRKTIHFSSHPNSPQPDFPPPGPPQVSPSSTEDWTGDEVFYHPIYSRQDFPNDDDDIEPPTRHDSPMQTDFSKPADRSWNPPRAPRSMISIPPRRGMSRFRQRHAPVASSPIAGVPLCMEEHPPSEGSDADDEDDEVEKSDA